MAKLQDNYYMLSFSKLVNYSLKEAILLQKILSNYDKIRLSSEIINMHTIEHDGDKAKHDLISMLIKEFITPIEREDIIEICQKIDNVTDAIEDVLLKLYMYNVKELRSEVKDFIKVIIESCEALDKAFIEFPNFKKSSTIKNHIVEINRLEEVADKIYTEAVRRLFTESKDPIEIIIWEDIFLRFEICCDSCEDVADYIETVIMKNI